MAIPWILSIGFTVAISALYSKASRINRVLSHGSGFRRVKVEAADVIRPCLILLFINIVLLVAWTASPWSMSWHRIYAENFDDYGRSVESYGVCRPDGQLHFIFTVPLVLANVMVLLMATYQSWKARNLPTELSETKYLAFSLLSLTETFVMGSKSLLPI